MLFAPNIDVERGRGPYCGPTAVMLLTGEPLSRIEKMIRRRRRGGYRDINGKRIPIRGTYTWEITRVLKTLGCKVEKLKRVEGETINSLVTECLPSTGAFLIVVTGHFMVASGGMIADTTHQTPIPIKDYGRKTRRVEQVWKVVRRASRGLQEAPRDGGEGEQGHGDERPQPRPAAVEPGREFPDQAQEADHTDDAADVEPKLAEVLEASAGDAPAPRLG